MRYFSCLGGQLECERFASSVELERLEPRFRSREPGNPLTTNPDPGNAAKHTSQNLRQSLNKTSTAETPNPVNPQKQGLDPLCSEPTCRGFPGQFLISGFRACFAVLLCFDFVVVAASVVCGVASLFTLCLKTVGQF